MAGSEFLRQRHGCVARLGGVVVEVVFLLVVIVDGVFHPCPSAGSYPEHHLGRCLSARMESTMRPGIRMYNGGKVVER